VLFVTRSDARTELGSTWHADSVYLGVAAAAVFATRSTDPEAHGE